MYAVKFKFTYSQDWMYVSPAVIVSEGDIKTKDYPPSVFLCPTLEEAQKMYLHILSEHQGYLKCIKISRMNKYSNYRTEIEVVPGYWREWE